MRLRGRGAPAHRAFAALFHHDLLGPAVAEALAHGSGLDPRLERQGLARHTECLVARRFGINHSAVLILSNRAQTHVFHWRFKFLAAVLSSSAIRYWTSI